MTCVIPMNNSITDSSVQYGKIIKSTGGLFTVEVTGGQDKGKIYECRAKGTFKRDKKIPLAGDNVGFLVVDEKSGFITEIGERKNFLIRPATANVDVLIIVVASASPEPDLFILDQLIAIANYNDIEVLLVINKCDIKSGEELAEIYKKAGIDTVCVSALKGESEKVQCIKEKIKGKTAFFSGASGVGKTSILNLLYPELSLVTGEISKKISRGKHTTRLTELFKVDDDTYIGDTPGFSMIDVVEFNLLTLSGLLPSFPDIEKYAFGCRYTDCTHICEDGCVVVTALNEGKIQKSRHESYSKLYTELKKVKFWENK